MESNACAPAEQARCWNLAAAAIIAVTIIAVLKLHIAPALIVGLGIFLWARWMLRWLDRGRGRWIARPLVMMLTVLIVIALGFLAQFGIQRGLDYLIHQGPGFLTQVQALVDQLRAQLPSAIGNALPTDIEKLKAIGLTTLRDHAGSLASLGREGVHAAFQLMLATIIALAAALATRVASQAQAGPLTHALAARGEDFLTCFKALLGAQVYIACANTTFTIIYLYGILPRFDVVLPYRELVCLLTFGLGLLPVVGNLIANTLLTVIALTHSMLVAVVSLTYLIVIHKLEYFINARIVGQKIHASVWELVCAMLLMEAIFGIAGLVLAPVFYAFIKMQLKLVRWL